MPLEHLDKQLADDFALLLRLEHAVQLRQKTRLGVYMYDLNAHVISEGSHDLFALMQAQQAIIDKHACEALADGLMQNRRRDSRVHAAGKPKQHLALAYLPTDAGNRIGDDIAGRPTRRTPADVMQKAADNAFALPGVGDLRVELQAIELARLIGHTGQRGVFGRGDNLEPRRQCRDAVAV